MEFQAYGHSAIAWPLLQHATSTWRYVPQLLLEGAELSADKSRIGQRLPSAESQFSAPTQVHRGALGSTFIQLWMSFLLDKVRPG